jgi:membrane protein
MPSPTERARDAVDRGRRRSTVFDHAYRSVRHYSRVNGSGLAGSVTYYAFLSFFPILAIGFFMVGYVSRLYPSARDNLERGVSTLLPHLLGSGPGEIRLSTFQNAAGTAGLLGLVGLMYTGLSWLTGMRRALETTFEMPRSEYPSFVVGKLRDLAFLAVVGLSLVLSIAVTGVVTGSSTWLLDLVDLGHGLGWTVHVLGALVGTVTNVLLFYTLFRLVARPELPTRALLHGALVGAVGFEILKLGSTLLLVSARGKPAFQAFGIALIVLIWINYFSRVVMLAASWAYTSPSAREHRAGEHASGAGHRAAPRTAVPVVPLAPTRPAGRGTGADPRLAFGAGVAAALGLVAWARRRRRPGGLR